MMQELAQKDGVLVYANMIDWRWYLPSAEDLEKHLPLNAVYQGEDGFIFKAALSAEEEAQPMNLNLTKLAIDLGKLCAVRRDSLLQRGEDHFGHCGPGLERPGSPHADHCRRRRLHGRNPGNIEDRRCADGGPGDFSRRQPGKGRGSANGAGSMLPARSSSFRMPIWSTILRNTPASSIRFLNRNAGWCTAPGLSAARPTAWFISGTCWATVFSPCFIALTDLNLSDMETCQGLPSRGDPVHSNRGKPVRL